MYTHVNIFIVVEHNLHIPTHDGIVFQEIKTAHANCILELIIIYIYSFI